MGREEGSRGGAEGAEKRFFAADSRGKTQIFWGDWQKLLTAIYSGYMVTA